MKFLQFFLGLFLSSISTSLFSQFYNDETRIVYELGVGLGAMNCVTDIGGAKTDNAVYLNEIQLDKSNFSPSIYAGFRYQNFVGARIEATIGMVEGADSTITGKSGNLISKNVRNLSFRSKIAEVALVAEFHPLTLLNFEIFPFFSPYILGGVGYFSFNPQGYYRGQWVDLQPLRLEGQGFAEYPDRKIYRLSGMNFPIGVGARYDISDLLNIRVEFLHRILFTDYLDDASEKVYIDPSLFSKYLPPAQVATARALHNRTKDGSIPIFRGNVKEKDAYMTLSLKLGVSLGRDRNGRAGTRQLRCFFR
jgi:hypothetical protein